MRRITFQQWSKEFEAQGEADAWRKFRRFDSLFCVRSKRALDLLEGTRNIVKWLFLEGHFGAETPTWPEVHSFLRMQTYDPSQARGASFVIGIHSDGFGKSRVVSSDVCFTDLADFHSDYRLRSMLFLPARGQGLTATDHEYVITRVDEDIHFDFGTDVKIIYDCDRRRVHVTVCDVTRGDTLPPVRAGSLIDAWTQKAGEVRGTVKSIGPRWLYVKPDGQGSVTTVQKKDVLRVIRAPQKIMFRE